MEYLIPEWNLNIRSLSVDLTNCQFVRNEGRFSGDAAAVGSFSKRLNYFNSSLVVINYW